MPTQVQFRRGTTAQNNNFVGAVGELSIDIDRGVIRVHNGSTHGGTEMVSTIGTVTNAINLVGGAAGSLPYQSANNTTSFLPIGSAGYVLATDGTNISWTSLSSLTSGSGVNANNVFVNTPLNSDNLYLVGSTANGDYESLEADTGANAPYYNVQSGLFVNSTLTVSKNVLPSNNNINLGSLTNPFHSLYVTTGSIYIGSTVITGSANGGISINESLIVTNDTIGTLIANSATNIVGGLTGQFLYQTAPGVTSFVNTSNIYVNSSVNAQTLYGGTAGQIVYQSAANTTAFAGPGTAGQILVSAGTSAPTYTSTGSIYVGNATTANVLNPGNTSTQQVGFSAIAGKILSSNTQTQTVGFADIAGSILAANTTTQAVGFANVSGSILANNTASQYVGFANESNNIIGGTAGQLVYQSGVGATAFAGPGTAGQILVSAGTSSPTYTNTITIQIGFADTAGKLLAANTATQAVGFANVAGKLLAANTQTQAVGFADTTGRLLPANTSSQYVGYANESNNLLGGATGQFAYQTSLNSTGFISTSNIYVNNAVNADTVRGGTTGAVVYQSSAGVTSFLALSGTTNSLVAAGTSGPQYVTQVQAQNGGTASYTTSTGQNLVVTQGGIGVTGASYFDNNIGVGGSMYVAGDLYVEGTQFVVNSTSISSGDKTLILSTASTTAISASNSGIQIGTTPYISFLYDGVANWASSGGIQANTTTNATSTSSGAIISAGGVGVAKDIYVGGNATVNGNETVNGTLTHNGLVMTAGGNVDQIYSSTRLLTLTTNWQATGISGSALTTGSYIVQILANDTVTGGGEVNTYYTGVMSWYGGQTGENSYNEIVLHRAGAAEGAGNIFLRVYEVNGGTLSLQIAGTTNNIGASNYTFSFRRMI